jgi:hypothetical protein
MDGSVQGLSTNLFYSYLMATKLASLVRSRVVVQMILGIKPLVLAWQWSSPAVDHLAIAVLLVPRDTLQSQLFRDGSHIYV